MIGDTIVSDPAETKTCMTMGSQSDAEISVAEQALRLTEFGFHVFPVDAEKKSPLTPHGVYDATKDTEQIRVWWTKYPQANIGINCKYSKIFAIDIDEKGKKHGMENWLNLCDGLLLPRGPQQATPHGGIHLIYKYPEDGREVPTNTNELADGIDIRGEKNGYIATGKGYRWIVSYDQEVPNAPAWLMDLVMATATRKNAPPQKPTAPITAADPTIGGQLLRTYVKRAQTAPRNCTGFDLACQLRDNGIDKEQAEALMREYAEQVPQEDRSGAYTVQEALASLEQAFTREPRDPIVESEAANEKKTQLTTLIELSGEVEIYRDSSGRVFATYWVGNHKENWPINSKNFRQWLAKKFYEKTEKVPSTQALQEFVDNYLTWKAMENQTQEVNVRIANKNNRIYFDLGNANWEVIEITAEGWGVIDNPPVKFRRSKGMLPLPMPVHGGSVKELKKFVNVTEGDDNEWVLLVSWIIGLFSPSGPFSILIIQGEQGSAKSTTAKILSALLDPGVASPRSAPSNERDMQIAAQNQMIISYDNLSGIPMWLSDALCRLASGSGLATRELYSNDDETLFSERRPLIINGIDAVPERNDLMDRSIFLTLPRIKDENRRTEGMLWKEFEEAQPRILGAIFTIVSEGLKNIDATNVNNPSRMADFEKIVVACEPALPWEKGTFQSIYHQNRTNAVEDSLESDNVANAIIKLVKDSSSWRGTAAELLAELEKQENEKVVKSKAWPSSARMLAAKLKRSIPALRGGNIQVEFSREKNIRKIHIEKQRPPIDDDTILEDPNDIRAAMEEIHRQEKTQVPSASTTNEKPATKEEKTWKNVYRPSEELGETNEDEDDVAPPFN